ncbi:MAG: RNA polymerase sigma factor [Polyangiaceae bacterium]
MSVEQRWRRTHDRSDDLLLAAIAAGDLGALGELYDRYAHDVWRATYRMHGNGADAEDIVHHVFMKLPQIAKSYDGRPNARPWLIGIAARITLRHRRSLGRLARVITAFATMSPTSRELNPERETAGKQELNAVDAAIRALSAKKRIVLTLIELEGLTSDEVARALSIPPATVRTRLHHARREIHAAIEAKKETEGA